ncbi:MAG: RNA pseudouridine synthase [Planctomycetes bacterium]|nr:RNA pseudouridine synthase [Planctomycetota bacterium]MDP6424252.1 RluA family pseudouridine synthase [Planctomycetota bacterium]MDP7340320.1 RluA family pseudouridine synthase [Vicinamibacterales bacterium]
MIPRVPGEQPADLSRPIETVRARIYPELSGLRLDQALAKLLPWRSRSSVQRLIKGGYVAIESRADPARASVRVAPEDIVIVRVPPRVDAPEGPELDAANEFAIVYEDAWLVAIDKPAGLTVHPSGRRLSGTLINHLHARYRSVDDPDRDVVPRLCHRLDRETSGLILVAKNERAHAHVRMQFEALTVRKTYLAVVEGSVADDEGRIDTPLGPDSKSAIRLKIGVRSDGLSAITRFKVLQRAEDLSLVECFPETGRQHQIRVHLASIGHPIVGDKLYGPDETWFLQAMEGNLSAAASARLRLPRHALHSHTLRLQHPRTNEQLDLTAVLPTDMADLCS